MCFFFSIAPATVFMVLGYFVLFSTTRVDGPLRGFGQLLALWVFLVAAAIPLLGAYVTLSGLCPIAPVLRSLG